MNSKVKNLQQIISQRKKVMDSAGQNTVTGGHIVSNFIPEWRETRWSKVSCLRKQHDGRDQAPITDLQVESNSKLGKSYIL